LRIPAIVGIDSADRGHPFRLIVGTFVDFPESVPAILMKTGRFSRFSESKRIANTALAPKDSACSVSCAKASSRIWAIIFR